MTPMAPGDPHAFRELCEKKQPDYLRQTLQTLIGEKLPPGVRVEDCRLAHFDFKPGRSKTLIIQARFSNGSRPVGEQTYYGRFRGAGGRRHRPPTARRTPEHLVAPAFGPPSILIPEWNLHLLAYPNDPQLRGLALMEDHEQLERQIAARPADFGVPEASIEIDVLTKKMITYVPGMRCGALFTLAYRSGKTPARHMFFGKAYREAACEEAYQTVAQIAASEPFQQGRLLIPKPYSCDRVHGIIWQEAVEGTPLAKIEQHTADYAELAREIGRRLAVYHGLDLALPDELPLENHLAELSRTVQAINRTFPGHEARIAPLHNHLLQIAADMLRPERRRPLHVSFKLSHILLTAKGVLFIDFDGAKMGDPGYDLGRFIAHLYKMLMKGELERQLATRVITNFCDAYNEESAAPLEPERIGWFTAFHLLSSQAFKTVKRGKPRLLEDLIACAEEALPR